MIPDFPLPNHPSEFASRRKRKSVDLEELKSDHGAKADAVGKLLEGNFC